MPNIGVSTACYYPLETELSLEQVGKSGIKNTEIFFNAESELVPEFVNKLIAIKNFYEIEVASIHPTMSLAESFMIFSAYRRRFDESLDKFNRYSEIAAELGAKYIIMHGGKPNGVLNEEEYCERYMQLKNVAKKNGITILQENVAKYRAGDINFLRDMVNILGNEAEFCIDIKQSIRSGYDPIKVTNEFFKNIKHFHISDHTKEHDCLLPYNGIFNFKEFFKNIDLKGFSGACEIEVYKDCYTNYSEISKSYQKMLNIY